MRIVIISVWKMREQRTRKAKLLDYGPKLVKYTVAINAWGNSKTRPLPKSGLLPFLLMTLLSCLLGLFWRHPLTVFPKAYSRTYPWFKDELSPMSSAVKDPRSTSGGNHRLCQHLWLLVRSSLRGSARCRGSGESVWGVTVSASGGQGSSKWTQVGGVRRAKYLPCIPSSSHELLSLLWKATTGWLHMRMRIMWDYK